MQYLGILLLLCLFMLLSDRHKAYAKTDSTLYPESVRINARKNIERFEWAKMQRDAVLEKAAFYANLSDQFLWEWVPEQTISRSHQVNQARVCPNCGRDMPTDGKPKFISDPVNDRWRLKCRVCSEVFPRNDFSAFYQSGKDQRFLFDPSKADRSLLYNTEHPHKDDPLRSFQVDDGTGWLDKDGEKFFFIGVCGDSIWLEIFQALKSLSYAYLFTDDPQYAHKAAILLDRIADVYPDMDWRPWHKLGHYQSQGGTGRGKIRGCIWECGTSRILAETYDAIYPALENDSSLVHFLSEKAAEYSLPGDKSSAAGIKAHIEQDILFQIGNGIINKDIRGNHGMHQCAMVVAALVLDRPEVSEEWIRWVFRDGPPRSDVSDNPASGGDLMRVLADLVDRDGMGDEASPSYNSIWPGCFLTIAELLEKSDRYRNLCPLRDSAKFSRMFETPARLVCLDSYVPSIGDSGKTGAPGKVGLSLDIYIRACKYWKSPFLAQIVYLLNGNTVENLHGSIFDEEPDRVASDVQKVIECSGPLNLGSVNLNGYGLSILRSGEGEHARALWLYYGRNSGHGHRDTLNLGMYGFGIDLLPDLGYPEYTGPWPNRVGWTDITSSHNTVTLNRRKQDQVWVGHLKLFSEGSLSRIVEVSAEKAYSEARLYRRTTSIIDISPDDFYTVDIFRVVGGEDHRWSFHAAEGEVTTQRLVMFEQREGTYAGEDISFGDPYDGEFTWGYGGGGFQFLYDVRRDHHPPRKCSVVWQIKDTWKVWNRARNVRLRVTLIDPPGEVVLAHGDPPQNKQGNPRRLTYLLVGGRPMRRDTSMFISVIEPYENNRKIRKINRVTVNPDTDSFDRLQAVALKIETTDGRIDYIISALDDKILRKVDRKIEFSGRFGVLSVRGGVCERAHLVGGALLAGFGARVTLPCGHLTGRVLKMSREPEMPSWIDTDLLVPDNVSLTGKWVLIQNDGKRDAAFMIEGIQRKASGTRLILGNVTLTRGVTRTDNNESEFLYDFTEGSEFIIPLDAVMEY